MSSDLKTNSLSFYLISLLFNVLCILWFTVYSGFSKTFKRLESTLLANCWGRAWEKGREESSACVPSTRTQQHLPSIWTKPMKGERSSYWSEGNRDGRAQKPFFGQPPHGVSPSAPSSRGLDTRHSHPGSHDIDSLAGNPSPHPQGFLTAFPRTSILLPRRECPQAEEIRGHQSGCQVTRLLRAAPSGQARPARLWNQRPAQSTETLSPGNFITMQLGRLALPGRLQPCLLRDSGSSSPGPGTMDALGFWFSPFSFLFFLNNVSLSLLVRFLTSPFLSFFFSILFLPLPLPPCPSHPPPSHSPMSPTCLQSSPAPL